MTESTATKQENWLSHLKMTNKHTSSSVSVTPDTICHVINREEVLSGVSLEGF